VFNVNTQLNENLFLGRNLCNGSMHVCSWWLLRKAII